jgi:hypothetical protein
VLHEVQRRFTRCVPLSPRFKSVSKKSVFVLRQAQHERTIFNEFNPQPVRPELVEG